MIIKGLSKIKDKSWIKFIILMLYNYKATILNNTSNQDTFPKHGHVPVQFPLLKVMVKLYRETHHNLFLTDFDSFMVICL